MSEADQIIGIYQRHAHHWDRARGKTLFERPWLDAFAQLLPPGGAVLDIGCGSGDPIARHLIERGFRVTGVDSAPAMIDICRSRLQGEWIVSDMRDLALGQTFDGLIAWDSFFHLRPDDQRAMIAVFRSHARPGSALMFTSGPSFGEAIGSFEGEPLYHASLAPDEYRALLRDAGFAVLTYVAEDPRCGGHTIWLAQCG